MSQFPCTVDRDRILAAQGEKLSTLGEMPERDYLGLSVKKIRSGDGDEIWRVWVLANLCQRASEKYGEAMFVKLSGMPDMSILFSPRELDEAAQAGSCPLLADSESVHGCDYHNRRGECRYPEHQEGCIMKRVCNLLAAHPMYNRIARTLVSTAMYLRPYRHDMHAMYLSLKSDGRENDLLDILRATSGLKNGRKVPSMFLMWMSNPDIYGVWQMDYSALIPVDINVRRVAKRSLSATNDGDVVRKIQALAARFDLNVRSVEMAFLSIGQNYCHRNDPDCGHCPLGR